MSVFKLADVCEWANRASYEEIKDWISARMSGKDDKFPTNRRDGEYESQLIAKVHQSKVTIPNAQNYIMRATMEVFATLFVRGHEFPSQQFHDLSLVLADIVAGTAYGREACDILEKSYELLPRASGDLRPQNDCLRLMRVLGFRAEASFWINEWQKDHSKNRIVFQALLHNNEDSLFGWLDQMDTQELEDLAVSQQWMIRKKCSASFNFLNNFWKILINKNLNTTADLIFDEASIFVPTDKAQIDMFKVVCIQDAICATDGLWFRTLNSKESIIVARSTAALSIQKITEIMNRNKYESSSILEVGKNIMRSITSPSFRRQKNLCI